MTIDSPQHENVGALVPLEKERDYATEAKEQVKKLSIEDDLHKFFLKLFEHKKQNEKEWLDIKRQWVRSRNYFDGRQFGKVTNSLQWVDYEMRPGEQTFMDNVYHPHIQTALMELTRSSVDLSFTPTAKDSRLGELVARIAEKRYRTHRQKTFGALKSQQENLSLLFNGVALRYTYWNQNDKKEKVPQFQGKDIQGGESLDVCSYCSAPMQGRCQYCGSTETKQIASQGYSTNVISGYDEIECGESDWVSVDPLGVTFYLHAPCLEDSPYIIWEQDIITEVLQSRFPDIKIDDGSESQELQWKSESDADAPNDQFFADGKDSSKNTAEFMQGWFDPPLYANRIIKQDVKLRNGTVLKANTKLGQYFPKGLYLAKNCKNILDANAEHKMDHWSAAPYVTRLGTLVGAGTSVALANQDNLNDLRNLEMKVAFTDAFSKEFVNGQFLEGENVPDDPSERAMVVNWDPANGRMVGGVIDRLPPMGLSPDVAMLEEKITASMQLQMGTFSGASAESMPDAVQDTATGFLAWRNVTIGRYAPMLAAKADGLDKEQAYQFLENDQNYLSPKEWEKIKGDYDAESVQAFLKCDLRNELIIEVVAESYMPTTQADKRAKNAAFVQMVTEAQIPPSSEMGAYLAEDYGIPKHLVGFDAAKSVAYEQVFAFKAMADQVVAQLGDIPTFQIDFEPHPMAPQMPFDPADPKFIAFQLGQLIVSEVNKPVEGKMDDLEAIADTLRDWWSSDEGRSAPNALRAAILVRMTEIDMAMVKAAQEEGQKMMAMQAPMMEQQMAMEGAEAEAEGAQADKQIAADEEKDGRAAEMKEMEMVGKATEQVMSAEENEKQRAHEMQMTDKTQSHDLQMAKEKSKQDLFKSRKEKKKASK